MQALNRQPTERTPIWVMRQAGRYLPEYRKVRAQAGDFMTLASTPELACEVTLQPIRRFKLDAAIIFSDILTIPDAMGLGLHFISGEGPKFTKPIKNEKDIDRLPVISADSLQYVMKAIKLTVKELDNSVPLLGFCGSPWTVLTYMVENGSSKNFSLSKALLYKEPMLAHKLLEKITQSSINYLLGQIQSGVSAIQIFDSWGGVLTPQAYQDFSLHYMKKIIAGIRSAGLKTPIILFSKGVYHSLSEMAESGCNCLGIDWTTSLTEAKRKTQNKVSLQGNMDPNILYAREEVIRREARHVMRDYGSGPGHIFNLGHGMQPDMDPAKLEVLIDAIHSSS